jgi:hypothetical protein
MTHPADTFAKLSVPVAGLLLVGAGVAYLFVHASPDAAEIAERIISHGLATLAGVGAGVALSRRTTPPPPEG